MSLLRPRVIKQHKPIKIFIKITMKTHLNLHNIQGYSWCPKPIEIAMKTHLSFHNIHSDIWTDSDIIITYTV